MGLSQVTINRGQGGLGRPLTGKDHVSAMVALDETLTVLNSAPGLITLTNFKGLPVYGLDQAESLGIVEGGATTDVLWKHVKDFFTYAPGATLWIVIATETGIKTPATGWEVKVAKIPEAIHEMTNGEARQIALISPVITATEETALPSALSVKLALMEGSAPQIILIPSRFATTDPATAPDITASDFERIVMVAASATETKAGADSSALKFTSPVGAILGMIAGTQVHVSIAWPERFNISSAGHITPNWSEGQAGDLVDKGYLVLVKYAGLGGTYIAKSVNGAAATSDFARIELVRTMDKAVRNVRTLLLPKLNSPLYVDSAGLLGEDTTAGFKALARQALESMATAGEISDFAVIIDPTQNVLSTSTLAVTVKIIPVGSAEEIVVNIGYSLNL